jgi:hypothetical protein
VTFGGLTTSFVTPGITVPSPTLPDTRNLAAPPVASQIMDTNDDLGVRPSDHSFWAAVVPEARLLQITAPTLILHVSELAEISSDLRLAVHPESECFEQCGWHVLVILVASHPLLQFRGILVFLR